MKTSKYSRKREIIMDIMAGTKMHPSAMEVCEMAREREPGMSLATVYRNLREKVASGEVITLETDRGVVHYDADTSEHSHFICRHCGKITDIYQTSGLATSLRDSGYAVDHEKLILYGICNECNKD